MSTKFKAEQKLMELKEAKQAVEEIFGKPDAKPITIHETTITANSFIDKLNKEHAKLYLAVDHAILRELLAGEKYIQVIRLALPHIKTTKHEKAVLTLLNKLYLVLKGAHEDHLRIRVLHAIANADPALFFDFCRHPIMPREKARGFHKRLIKELNKRAPNREHVVELIGMYTLRRLLNDQTARTPLLYGPPGCGKSEIANQYAKAMTALGVHTVASFQSMAHDDSLRDDNEGALSSFGSSLVFNNAKTGNQYDIVKESDTKFGILIFDEADKTHRQDYLVGVLDTKNPLQDHFVREIAVDMDMRSKTLFLLTANDPNRLNRGMDDPLWSRLEATLLPAYTEGEMIELAITLAMSPENPYQPTRREARKAARLSVAELGTDASFRAILDHMNGHLFRSIVLEEPLVAQNSPTVYEQSGPYRRTNIGFRM